MSSDTITVSQDTEKLDLTGITAKLVYVSGKEVDVDLTTATITGFDASEAGEQDVTITVTKDDVSYKATITVVVEAAKKKGCSGSMSAMIILALAGLAFVATKKRKN